MEAYQLMDLIGATNAVAPHTLPRRARSAVKELVSSFLHRSKSANDREAAGHEAMLARMDAYAFALAARLMLRPEVQEILAEEAAKNIEI